MTETTNTPVVKTEVEVLKEKRALLKATVVNVTTLRKEVKELSAKIKGEKAATRKTKAEAKIAKLNAMLAKLAKGPDPKKPGPVVNIPVATEPTPEAVPA